MNINASTCRLLLLLSVGIVAAVPGSEAQVPTPANPGVIVNTTLEVLAIHRPERLVSDIAVLIEITPYK